MWLAATLLGACGRTTAGTTLPLSPARLSLPGRAVPATETGQTQIPSPVAAATPTPSPTIEPTPDPINLPTIATVPSPIPSRSEFNPDPQRLQPGGPPHDPGPLDWAHAGPYLGPGFAGSELATFSSKQPLVTTYYFYWDDLTKPAYLDPGRTLHQPDPLHYSFLLPASHRRQFEDMQAAGIDFAVAVYWGEPGHPGRSFNPIPGHDWSTEGIRPMVDALDQMAVAGHPFKLGMFYDTTIMANADLTTPDGKAYFYANVRDFFSRIPPRHWAAIDGKPIVWLYDTLWVARLDQSSLDDLSARFARDFGGLRPYIVREVQWESSKGVSPQQVLHSDGLYGWGAAANGFNPDPRFTVAEVGPGFGSAEECKSRPASGCAYVDRAKGAYYARGLAAALASGRRIMAIETWNEFDESTGIAETIELGRTYIDITRRYADAFHAGRRALA